ncbi:hypothetical protein HanIR_Chr05g0252751 [Helianthus annuus]|nr:hypothetical protein HanIR_Chr05g0252751 [Helianthus annuus]
MLLEANCNPRRLRYYIACYCCTHCENILSLVFHLVDLVEVGVVRTDTFI